MAREREKRTKRPLIERRVILRDGVAREAMLALERNGETRVGEEEGSERGTEDSAEFERSDGLDEVVFFSTFLCGSDETKHD